jgi:hypothetical protein
LRVSHDLTQAAYDRVFVPLMSPILEATRGSASP